MLEQFATQVFWIGLLKIIGVNIILSGDNAVVIALACRSLPPKQRFWGILLGAGAAVLLRVLFTIIIAQIMGVPFLKLVGGLLLFYAGPRTDLAGVALFGAAIALHLVRTRQAAPV